MSNMGLIVVEEGTSNVTKMLRWLFHCNVPDAMSEAPL
jgi:hypothetical protein